jgi:DNA mismatch repair protein MutL
MQLLYVNGRYVKIPIILDAINSAYQALIPIHRHPAFFVKFTCDPRIVDVNIHPNKLIVKLDSETEIAKFLATEIRSALYSKKIHKNYQSEPVEKTLPKYATVRETPPENEIVDLFRRDQLKQQSKVINEQVSVSIDERSTQVIENKTSIYDDLSYIGQLMKTYLIYQKDHSLFLLDQHAAHEKILYERYVESIRSNTVHMQLLMAPVLINLSKGDLASASNQFEAFNHLGFELELFGENELLMRGTPVNFSISQSKEMIIYMLDRWKISDLTQDKLIDEHLIQQACKHAIKAHDTLLEIEASALIEALKNLQDPLTCPHGRPIIIEVAQREIEKMFNRV